MFKKQSTFLTILAAASLLAICALSYGLTAGKLGFFLDDWYIIWTYITFGTSRFVEFFRGDRPLFSMIYRIFIPLIQDSPIAWQLSAIFTKWLAALALWALLRLLFPNNKWLAYAVSALFAVYTGFKFHYFAVMYAQNYAIFAIYFCSFIFMVLAYRHPKQRLLFTFLGLVCQFIGIAPMELYYGLELIRPLVLFLITAGEDTPLKDRLISCAKLWLPYFMLLLGFTLFRVFFSSKLYSYQISFLDQLAAEPLRTILQLLARTWRGWLESSVKVWLHLVGAFASLPDSTQNLLRAIVILASLLIAFAILNLINQPTQDKDHQKRSLWLILAGTFAVLVGMIPVIIAGLDVNLTFHYNRFLLPLSIGSCLSVVAFVDLIFRNPRLKSLLIAVLIALSVGVNYLNGLEFQKAWTAQKDFFAQLTWRIPQIKPGTVLITTDLPFSLYYSGTSLTAPLNIIYAPNLHDNPIPYQMILAASPQMNTMPALKPGQAIDRTSRVFHFIGSTSNMITIYKPENGCLKVLSPQTNPAAFQSDRYAQEWAQLISLSNLSRIDTQAAAAELPSRYFGDVSTNTWCYYYEHAALEEQRSNWQDVISIYQRAEKDGFSPNRSDEWLPLITAHIQLGEVDTALSISEDLHIEDDFTALALCSVWQESPLAGSSSLSRLFERWGCGEE